VTAPVGWVVLLNNSGSDRPIPFGPFREAKDADDFAAFLTMEVDPAVPLMSPTRELLSFWHQQRTRANPRPIGWPPKPGDIWEDDSGDRWVCVRTPNANVSYLQCLARGADDAAEEIWRMFGPMTRIQYVAPTNNEEPPF
jgi:hypothetical protein